MRQSFASLCLLAAVALTACSDSATGPSDSLLTPGVARSISGAEGSEREFRVQVPAGTGSLRVALTGGTGDADIYLRFGSPPEPTAFDCGSDSFGEDEECHFDDPTAGTWYIVVVGFEAYSNVSLLASLGSGTGATVLTSGVAESNLFGAAGSARHFRITVPNGGANLTVTTSGGTGDLDLYVRRGALATEFVYDCGSNGSDNVEDCSLTGVPGGTYYILVHGFGTYDGATLTATVSPSALRLPSAGSDGWLKQGVGR